MLKKTVAPFKENGLKESHKKLDSLKNILKKMGSVLVAFSGGVDSTFLLKVSADTVKRVAALTAASPAYPDCELKDAKKLAKTLGIPHVVMDSNELLIPGFKENPSTRCYLCKSELFRLCREKARELNLNFVIDGTNADDALDFRPGGIAAKEKNIRSPLKEAGLKKAEIRLLSKSMGLSTWDKPQLACLSSRFPYGVEITEGRLKKIAECEEYLKKIGLKHLRVRYHGDIARIEVNPLEIKTFFDEKIRQKVVKRFKDIGFAYITLDMEGYRTGSMNEVLKR